MEKVSNKFTTRRNPLRRNAEQPVGVFRFKLRQEHHKYVEVVNVTFPACGTPKNASNTHESLHNSQTSYSKDINKTT